MDLQLSRVEQGVVAVVFAGFLSQDRIDEGSDDRQVAQIVDRTRPTQGEPGSSTVPGCGKGTQQPIVGGAVRDRGLKPNRTFARAQSASEPQSETLDPIHPGDIAQGSGRRPAG